MKQINQKVRREIGSSMNFNNNTPYLVIKGTPGIGDAMYALNLAHNRSFIFQTKVNLLF